MQNPKRYSDTRKDKTMSWDHYENDDGTMTICRMEWNPKWGNWGEAVVSKEMFDRFQAGDKITVEQVWGMLK